LAGAHGAFVDRYGAIDYRKKLCGLVNDGYIHRHLTWHLVMAGWEVVVHELLGASDGVGRNAWFEACEDIGEPAIFVQDVKRAWGLAEEIHERNCTQSIIFQFRYLLMNSTLKSLASNILQYPELIIAAVEQQYWTSEKAWSYIEQMTSEEAQLTLIIKLSPHFSKRLLRKSIDIVLVFESKVNAEKQAFLKANVKKQASLINTYSPSMTFDERKIRLAAKGLDILRNLDSGSPIQIKNYSRDDRIPLKNVDTSKKRKLLNISGIIDNQWHCETFNLLEETKIDEALKLASKIEPPRFRASALRKISEYRPETLPDAIDATLNIADAYAHAYAIHILAKKYSPLFFDDALDVSIFIRNESDRAYFLCWLTRGIPKICFPRILSELEKIQNYIFRDRVLDVLHERQLCEPSNNNNCNQIALSIQKVGSKLQDIPCHSGLAIKLHALAYYERKDIMSQITMMYQQIVLLGGENAMRGVVDEMKRICRQWP
jgi:hypothetical protein